MKKFLPFILISFLLLASCSSPDEKSIAVFDEQIEKTHSKTTVTTNNSQYDTKTSNKPAFELNIFTDKPEVIKNHFKKPMGITVDSKNNIYVIDQDENSIFKFNESGKLISRWGEKGQFPGELNEAKFITTSKDDKIVITDTWNQRIQIFKPDGELEDIINLKSFGPKGLIIQDNKIYYADTGHHTIQIIDFEGKPINSIGKNGKIKFDFHEPTGITNDKDGNIYIADSRNNRIVKLDKNLKYLKDWKVKSWVDKKSGKEAYLVVDNDKLYLSDPISDSILVFTTEGKALAPLEMEIKGPSGLCVHNKNLYIVDYHEKSFHKIKLR